MREGGARRKALETHIHMREQWQQRGRGEGEGERGGSSCVGRVCQQPREAVVELPQPS